MKDYNFERDNHEFDETIKLDSINKEVQSLEEEGILDDLGDKNDFLNAFESEKLDEHTQKQESRRVMHPDDKDNEGGFWNAKTIGIFAAIAVLVGIACFAIVRSMFPSAQKPQVDEPPVAEQTQEARPMVVKNILDNGEFVVYDIENASSKSLTLAEGALIADEKGAIVSKEAVHIGELLMVTLDESGKQATDISFGEGIHRKESTGLTVDMATRTLSNDDEFYTYDAQAMFIYNNEMIKPNVLEPCDVLLLKGVRETLWVVEVLEYHGYIVVENKENVKNGMFQLDDGEEIPLEELERIPVKEGTHTITVSGENIEKRTDSVFVETGVDLVYDLSKTQEKVGVLIIDTDVTDYRLYINGTLVDSTTPAVLPLGEYDLVILKSGYRQWDAKVDLNADTVTVRADLEKDVQYGTLTITSDEPGAAVWINEKEMGTTPMDINLPYGMYQIEIEKEDFGQYMGMVTIANSHETFHAILEE